MDEEAKVSVELTKKEWDMIASLAGFAYDTKQKLDRTMNCLDNDCCDNAWMNNEIYTALDNMCEQAGLSILSYVD